MERVLGWLLVAAAAAALLAGCVWGYQHWRGEAVAEGDATGSARVQHFWDEDAKRRGAATIVAIERARAEERQAAAEAAKGERDAREKAEKQAVARAAAAASAVAAGRGLRDTIAGLNASAASAGIPDAAACPAEFVRQRDAAVRARTVLDACRTAYTELAGATDDAIGAMTLKLDTAMAYIGAVQQLSPPSSGPASPGAP